MMLWFRRGIKKGQITPFLIAVIVILLSAIMIAVNVGKVSMTKTNTANAADAGALAGGTHHTNTLNTLADTNTAMIAEYLTMVALFAIPYKSICLEPTYYGLWLAFMAAQATQFATAWQAGVDGYNDARDSAKQLAFSNANIDEAKTRRDNSGGDCESQEKTRGTCETYEQWLQRKSRFEEWTQEKGYVTSDHDAPSTYEWTDKQGGQNYVTVDPDAPGFPGLLPMPGVLVGMYTDGPFPPFVTCPTCNVACAVALKVYLTCALAAGATPIFVPAMSGVPCLGCCPCPSVIGVTISPGVVHTSTYTPAYILGSAAACGFPVSNTIFYPVPIAFIADIVEDNPEISVTVTRKEPQRALGPLWNMKYEDPQRHPGRDEISSRARARTSGGRVGPAPDPDYDSELISGGY